MRSKINSLNFDLPMFGMGPFTALNGDAARAITQNLPGINSISPELRRQIQESANNALMPPPPSPILNSVKPSLPIANPAHRRVMPRIRPLKLPTISKLPAFPRLPAISKRVAQARLPSPPAPLSATATKIVSATKNPIVVFGLFGIFLWLLYSKKETFVTNIEVNLLATTEKKNYKITLGKEDHAISVEFAVKAGEPLDSLSDTNGPDCNEAGSFTLYNAKKGKEHHFLCDIIITDPLENTSLSHDPITQEVPISDKEFIRIIHRQSATPKDPSNVEELVDEDSDEAPRIRKITIDASSPEGLGKHHLPPFDSESLSQSDEYLLIEQATSAHIRSDF